MKLLLTSAGVKNAAIHDALVGLLGRPIGDATALCVPTASYASSGGGAAAWRFLTGRSTTPMCELGWKSLGVLELTALPSAGEETWVGAVEAADVLLVNGGDPLYLNYWMKESGLAARLPSLPDLVYVGLSAGSMVLAPTLGEGFARWRPPSGDETTLGVVDYSIFPHLDHPDLPENTMADAEAWAASLSVPGYAIDDQTALRVVDGVTDVISEGRWRLFPR